MVPLAIACGNAFVLKPSERDPSASLLIVIGIADAYRGERAKAFDWLDRAVVLRDPGLINIKTDPLFAGLRGEPRYKTVLRKMNLPE